MMASNDRRTIVEGEELPSNIYSPGFGGGPPTGGDMAARLLRLEDQHTGIMTALARIETRLDSIDDKLAGTNHRIDETNNRIDRTNNRIDTMPDKFWTSRMMIWIVAGTFALLLTVNKIFEIIEQGF